MKIQALLLLIIPLMTSCGVMHATNVGADGSKATFFTGAIGGKTAIAGIDSPAVKVDAYTFDGEKSLRDAITGATVAYIGHVIGGAVKAGIAAETSQHAATQATTQAQNAAAAKAAETAAKADLIRDVGIPGEVPIGPINLP